MRERTGRGTATFTLMDDGSPTAVSCSITFATDGVMTCDSGAATATISPASELSLRIAMGNGDANVQDVRFGWRATTP